MPTTTESDEVVVFLVDGEEKSHDERYAASKLAEQLREQEQARTDRVNEQVQASADGQHEELQGYKELDGKALKALAVDRGLDVTGLKKKSQLIALLEENDAKGIDTTITGDEIARPEVTPETRPLPAVVDLEKTEDDDATGDDDADDEASDEDEGDED